eukprot:scaffold214385_cov29-Tisochrysis_lutea.AAC.3
MASLARLGSSSCGQRDQGHPRRRLRRRGRQRRGRCKTQSKKCIGIACHDGAEQSIVWIQPLGRAQGSWRFASPPAEEQRVGMVGWRSMHNMSLFSNVSPTTYAKCPTLRKPVTS